MAPKKSQSARSKAKTLPTKTLSRKHASQARGGKGTHMPEVTIEVWRAGDTVKK